MLPIEVKAKIDKIWNDIYSYGLTNPLKVIEQMSNLFYIKGLDDREIQNELNSNILGIKWKRIFPEDKQDCRWSNFSKLPPEEMHNTIINKVFPFITTLSDSDNYARFLSDIVYELPSPIITDKVVKAIENLPLDDSDMKGDIYEYCLKRLQTAGQLGQFRTPRHIIEMMVKLTEPKLGDRICDPALGTAGFLIGASEYIKENQHKDLLNNDKLRESFRSMFYGYDTDPSMLRIAAMNITMHDISCNNINYCNSLSDDNKDCDKYSLILANPPFKGSLDKETISPSLKKICDTTKTELLFISLFLKSLEPGGRCACIVPEGVLFGSNKAYKTLREELIENHKLQAIISMPSGVFKPYTGVSTAIMLFTKTGTGGTDDVWFYDMKADGYSLDDKRIKVKDNDIEDIIARFHNLTGEKDRTRYDQSFLVPKAEIVQKGYELSINKYKEVEYESIEYDHPMDTIIKLKELEKDIIAGLLDLENKLQ